MASPSTGWSMSPPSSTTGGPAEASVFAQRRGSSSAALDDLAPRSAGVVIGDPSSATDTRNVANQVNAHSGTAPDRACGARDPFADVEITRLP